MVLQKTRETLDREYDGARYYSSTPTSSPATISREPSGGVCWHQVKQTDDAAGRNQSKSRELRIQ